MLTTEDIRKTKTRRIRADYGIRDLYKYYCQTTLSDLRQSSSTFSAVIKALNSAIVDQMLSKANHIHLPCRCGYMRIKKTKMSFKDTNSLRIDWAATKKANKKVYHMNEHRNNFRYRFYWEKPRMHNVMAYAFRPTRTNKRALAYILKNQPETDYFE